MWFRQSFNASSIVFHGSLRLKRESMRCPSLSLSLSLSNFAAHLTEPALCRIPPQMQIKARASSFNHCEQGYGVVSGLLPKDSRRWQTSFFGAC